MSGLHVRLRDQEKARREFVEHLCALHADLGMRVPVRFLDVRVRLLEELVEKTGGSLVTEHFRMKLGELKKQVAIRAEQRRRSGCGLRLVRAR